MNIVKLFATFLVVLVTGVAYAAPVCNHDADPTDPGRAHRDLSQNNLVSQRFISAGTEITMGYGKAGNKVTCLTKTQRLLVKTKDGVEYDAGCGNIIYSSPQVSAETQTEPTVAVTPPTSGEGCDKACQMQASCKKAGGTLGGMTGDTFVCEVGKTKMVFRYTIETQDVFAHKNLPADGDVIRTTPSQVQITGSAPSLSAHTEKPKMSEAQRCAAIKAHFVLDRQGDMLKVRIAKDSSEFRWQPVKNFNDGFLRHCGCPAI